MAHAIRDIPARNPQTDGLWCHDETIGDPDATTKLWLLGDPVNEASLPLRPGLHVFGSVSSITMGGKRNRSGSHAASGITITPQPFTLDAVGDKPGRGRLPPTLAENVRERLIWLLQKEFDNNRAALARALGLSRPAVVYQVDGINAPGWPTVLGLASYLQQDVSVILAPFSPSAVDPTIRQNVLTITAGMAQNMGDLVVLPRAMEQAKYPKLERAIAYFADESPARWSAAAVMLARQGYFDEYGASEWSAPEWAKQLDTLDETLRRGRSELTPKEAPSTPAQAPKRRRRA